MNDKVILNNLDTLKHICRVRELLYKVILELDNRARNHDNSKFESPEQEIFGEHGGELAKTEYNSEEYKQLLEKVKPAIEHHYTKNRHHPQFFKDGINGMDLIDLIELLMDWLASTERNKNGNIRKSIEINAEKFNISPQLEKILSNTIDRYF